MAASAPPQPLTIQERILLHLEPYAKDREAYTVAKEVTQAGIAAALGIRVAHASREVRKLTESNLAEERGAAVAGAKRHQKAYFLTPAGVVAAQKMRKELGPAAPSAAGAQGPGVARQGPVAVVRDLPPLRYFFGRREDLEAARRILETRGVLVTLGIAGIGKSTFGAKLLEEIKGARSCVWYPIHEYDTPASVLAPVARLLALLGRPKLEILTKREATVDLPRAREILMADVRGLMLAAFYDDPHTASPEALQALRVLREVASEHPASLKLVLLARTRPPIYDARDVTLKKNVGEVELSGLKRDETEALLKVGEKAADAALVYDVTGGHPLFVELLRDAGGGAVGRGADRRQIDRFVQEQIFSKLDRGEREALRRIVFLRRPVDPRVILSPPATPESLLTLESRSLLRRDAMGRVAAHESIRDFVRRMLTEEEERQLAQAAYGTLLAEVEEANRRDDPSYAIGLLEDALSLAPDDNATAGLLLKLGGFHLAIAQYNQAAARLEEALRLIERDPESPSRGLALFLLAAVHSEAGRADLARRTLDEASGAMEKRLGTVDPERGRLYLEYAKWEIRYGSSAGARGWIEKGVRVGQALRHDFILAEAEMLLSHISPARESNDHMERCIAIATKNEFSPLRSLAHSTYSWHLVDLFGDTERALSHAAEGLRIAEQLGNRVLIGSARAALAKAHWRAGDLASAMADARLGMETAEKSFTERIVPMALISTLATESGDARSGESIARDLLLAAETYGSPMEVLAARRALARSLDVQGRYADAVPLLESCHEIYQRTGLSCDAPNHVAILDRLIRMEVAQGEMERARRWFEEVKIRLPEIDSPVGGALQNMAFAHLRQTEAPAMAAAYYWRSAQTWRKLNWRLLELKMLVDTAFAVEAAAQAGETLGGEVPPAGEVEARITELTSQLQVPRPTPLQGTPLA